MELQDLIRRAIGIGHVAGFITFDQINELMAAYRPEPEEIDALLEALRAEAVLVVDN